MTAPHPPANNQENNRLSTRDIVADFLRDFTDADRGMLGTFLQLTIRPRRVVQTYLQGDRRRFIRPTRYLAFTLSLSAALFFVVQYWYGASVTDIMLEHAGPGFSDALEDDLAARQIEYSLSAEQVTQEREQIARMTEYARQVYRILFEYYSIFFVALIPVGAIIHRAFYPLNNFTVAESVVASLYIYSHSSLLAIALLPVCILLSPMPLIFLNGLFICYSVCLIYTMYAVQLTYGHRWWEFFFSWFTFCVVALVGLFMAYALGAFYFIFFLAENTLQYLIDYPLRVGGVTFLLLGGLLWCWLLCSLRFSHPSRATIRRRMVLSSTLLILLVITRWIL